MARVSVIIPTFRRPALLAAAIRSVLAQTYQDFDIVVVDDGSGDNTKEVVEGFREPRITYLAHRTNWQIAAARNTGVINSHGELIAFLDDDDEWLPEKLERQVQVFDRNARVTGAVYTGFRAVDRVTGEIYGTYQPSARGHILHELCRRNCVGTASTVVLRRECVEMVGLFDETMEFGEEYDMWIRIAHSYDFGCLPDPLVRYSVHGNRMSTNYEIMIKGMERQLRKHSEFFSAYPDDYSQRYLTLGALHCLVGHPARGRAAILRAVEIAPLQPKNMVYLGLSVFGKSGFRRLRPSTRGL